MNTRVPLYVGTHSCASMCRPEVDFEYFPLLLYILFFFLRQSLILNLELIVSDWLATKHDLSTSITGRGIRGMHRWAQIFKWVLEI